MIYNSKVPKLHICVLFYSEIQHQITNKKHKNTIYTIAEKYELKTIYTI